MTVSVISVDPAPSKGSTVCKGLATDDGQHFCEKTPEKLRHLLNGVDANTLVCWDAPLTGPRDPNRAGEADRDFSQRRIDSFFSRGATGFKTPSGISVLPYSGCPHWAITRSLIGLPRTGSWDKGYDELPFRLLPCTDERGDQRPSVVEIHPAVAAWLWCRKDEQDAPKEGRAWPYKKCRRLRKWMWGVICRRTRVANCPNPLDGDDDDFDAAVGYRLGVLYLEDCPKPILRRRVILLGDRETGSFLVPNVEDLLNSWNQFLKS